MRHAGCSKTLVFLLFAGCLLALQPLEQHDIWWNIARGRLVLDGNLHPSSELLLSHTTADSDWLRGTTSSLAYDTFGVTGLMLLKLAAATLIVVIACNVAEEQVSRFFPILIGLLLAVSPALDPSSATVDVLAILIVSCLPAQRHFFTFGVVALIWSNLSTGAIWAFPAAMYCSRSVPSAGRAAICRLGIAMGCLCLTPRGIPGLQDMLRLQAPHLFTESFFLRHSGLGQFELTTAALASLLIGLCAIVSPAVSFHGRLIAAVSLAGGLFNDRLLPAAAALSFVILLTEVKNCPSVPDPTKQKARIALSRLAALCAGVCVIWNITGGISGDEERLGWGLADSIDLRFAQRDFSPHAETRIRAHCTDSISAGMLLMECPSARVLYHPESALVSGRMSRFALLNHDLETSRKAAYQRQDGTTGGWWRGLINRGVTLLVVSPGRRSMLQALEPTVWKQLSLDGPMIPYALTGVPHFTQQIVQARSDRELIEFGPWQHQLFADSLSPSHADFVALLFARKDIRRDLEQAQVFQAIQLPVGATRTLLPVMAASSAGQSAFCLVQRDLAWDEHLQTGTISELRRQILNTLSPNERIPGIPWNELKPRPHSEREIGDEVMRLYLSGQPLAAVSQLGDSSPGALYARYVLYRDAGQPEESMRAAQKLKSDFPRHSLTAMIRAMHYVE